LTAVAKLWRSPPIGSAAHAQRLRAARTEVRALALLETYRHLESAAAAVVARQLGLTAQYVRRIRNKRT
jgi:hypothetical protein